MNESMQQNGEIDVNELFNEENLNNAALGEGILSENAILQDVSRQFVTSSAQAERIAEVASNGPLNKLAWAKTGGIARITNDGSAVELTIQRIDVRLSRWTSMLQQRLEPDLDDAVGLAWSTTGTELAVLERKGGVHIFSMGPSAVNVSNHQLYQICSDPNEFERPIGLLWMNLSRGENDRKKTVLYHNKENGTWKYVHVEGSTYPPHALRALCVVCHTGTFTLFYTRDAGPYRTVNISLPGPEQPSTFTHAALAQTIEGRLLVALHSLNGRISTYSVEIVLASENHATLNAEVVDHDVAGVPPYFTNSYGTTEGNTHLLTHFQFLQEVEYAWQNLEEPSIGPKQPTTLLAAYISYNAQKDAVRSNCFGATVIKRWQFQKCSFELHPAFGGNDSGIEESQIVVQALDDSLILNTVTNIQIIEPGNAMAITSISGETSLYDPGTMEPITPHLDFRLISSLGHVQLMYQQLIMSSVQCLSPHAMAMAYTDMNDKLVLTTPQRHQPLTDIGMSNTLDPNNAADSAIISAYVLSFSRSCWQQSSLDDILSSIHGTVPSSSLVHIRRALFRTLFQPKTLVPGPNNVSDLEKVPHSLIVYKALAFNFGLYNLHASLDQHEKLAYLWGWTTLNLRWTTQVIGDTYKSLHTPQQPNRPPSQPPTLPPSFLDVAGHNIRWYFGLCTLILQSINQTGDRATHPHFFDPPSFSVLLGDDLGTGSQGLIALLLSCSWSRTFLVILARLLKQFAKVAGVSINFANAKADQSQINAGLTGTTLGKIASVIRGCSLQYGITTAALETLFDSRWVSDTWDVDDAEANVATLERQIDMIATGKVGQKYEGVVKNILDNCVNGEDGLRARGEIDRSRIRDECPEASTVFLGIDDIALKDHSLTLGINGRISGNIGGTLATFLSDKSEDNTGINKRRKTEKPKRVLYDVHKKVLLYSHPSLAMNGTNQSQHGVAGVKVLTKEDLLRAPVRRCVRCGSMSDHVDPVSKTWPRSMIMMMNRCVCDGSWIVEEVGKGLEMA